VSRLLATLILTAVVLAGLAQSAASQPLPSFNTGEVYSTEAEFNAATRVYQDAIAANRNSAEAHYWLGLAHVYAYRQFKSGLAPYARRYLRRAIPLLRQAVRLDPTNIGAYVALHDALFLNGQRNEALRVLNAMRARLKPPQPK
jgi:tetratricopeptide (TPR) repeat protein